MGFRRIALLAIVLIGSMCAVMRADADTVNYKLNTNPDTAPSGFVSDPVGAVTHAREKIAAGDLDGAIKGLSVYVSVHPSEIGPKRFLGDLFFRAGDIGRAENIYIGVLREFPYDKETHNRLGTAYAVQNRVDDAIREFDASLPGTESVGDLVQLHQRRGDLPAYKRQTQRMADLYPSDPDMQSELGQVYAAVHEPYEAIVYFRRALDSDQASLTALNGLGLALMDIHDYSSAIAQFDKCLKMQPGSFQCLDNLGAAQLEDGSYALAQKTLDRVHTLFPERAEPLVNFGYLADAYGDWKKAVAYYARAIEVWPYTREAYIDIALAYEKHGLYPLAQAALLKGIAVAPDDGRLHVLLGEAYEAQGHREDAIAQYKIAEASLDPDIARLSQERFAQLESAKPKPQR